MTDKDFNYPPLDESEFGLLFDAAQKGAPEMDAEFLTRLQSQALEAMPQELMVGFTLEKLSLFGRISDVFAQFGGWPAGAGLAMAGAFGVLIGISPPDVVLDATTAYFQTESLNDLVGLGDETEFYWEDV